MSSKHKSPTDEIYLIKRSGAGDVGVALVYPNGYRIGMASLGFQTAYRLFNSIPGVYCERAFVETGDESHPKTVESGRPIGDFDVIAFSLSFELDAANIVRCLRRAVVPVDSKKRKDEHPLVILGGVAPTLNPEPYADFADLVVLGEAEEALPELMTKILGSRGSDRTKLLAEATAVPGVYAPRFYRVEYDDGIKMLSRGSDKKNIPATVERRFVSDLDAHPTYSSVLAPRAEFGDMGLLEIGRGCGRACRFCAAGHIYRPPRWRSLAAMEPAIAEMLKHRKRIGLVSSSGTDHPEVIGILDSIESRGGTVSFASVRADNLPDRVLESAARTSKTITIAPEAGTERLRLVAGKNIREYEILEAAERIGSKGIHHIKIYYLIGLPTETVDDVRYIAELSARILDALRSTKKSANVSASVAPFVPKPNTPFAYHPMENESVIRSRMDELRVLMRKVRIEVKFESLSESVFQALLSRGDRRASEIIKKAASPEHTIRNLLKDLPKWASDTIYAQRLVDDEPPWGFIDAHIGRKHLFSEYHQGLIARPAPACRPAKCRSCEACG